MRCFQVLFLFTCLLVSGTALAVDVKDTTSTLTSAQVKDLENVGTGFKVHVVIESVSAQGDLNTHMSACIDSPNAICIGLDPIHRWTSTHFGVDTGIRSGDFQQVARAGNTDFKQGLWTDGVKAIISRAGVMSQKTSAPAAVIVQNPVIKEETPVWPFVLGFGFLAVILAVVIIRVRRSMNKTMNEFRDEAAEMRSRNIKEQAWADQIEQKVTTQPTAQTVSQTSGIVGGSAAWAPTPGRGQTFRPAWPAPSYAAAAPASVVVIDNQPSFVEQAIVLDALSRSRDRDYEEDRRRAERDESDRKSRESTYSSSPSYDSGSDSSSSSSSDSGGDSSSYDSGGGGSDGGGDSSGF